MDVDLCREVAAGVHLVIHVEGGVLRVAEVIGGVGVVNPFREFFGIVTAGVDALAFCAVNYGCACILAERELPFGCHFGVAEHGQGNIFVV